MMATIKTVSLSKSIWSSLVHFPAIAVSLWVLKVISTPSGCFFFFCVAMMLVSVPHRGMVCVCVCVFVPGLCAASIWSVAPWPSGSPACTQCVPLSWSVEIRPRPRTASQTGQRSALCPSAASGGRQEFFNERQRKEGKERGEMWRFPSTVSNGGVVVWQ